MDDAFGHWLAGFIDGEGSFVILARGKNRTSYYPCFSLVLREDDEAIVEEIVRRTGIGRVYHTEQRAKDRPLRHRVEWRVVKKVDVVALAQLLVRYPLRAKKGRDFVIWREAVLLWSERRGHRGKGGRVAHPVMERLRGLKLAIEAGRTFGAWLAVRS